MTTEQLKELLREGNMGYNWGMWLGLWTESGPDQKIFYPGGVGYDFIAGLAERLPEEFLRFRAWYRLTK